MTGKPPRFACDAMLGSLARWLRAAGYDAFWQEGIPDWDLIRLSRNENRILLSCDQGIFRIGIVRDGKISALQIPNQMSTEEQLIKVLRHYHLALAPSHCMRCGGELVEVPPDQMADRIPPRTYHWVDRFWECTSCHQPFWKGTHWQRIQETLEKISQVLGPS